MDHSDEGSILFSAGEAGLQGTSRGSEVDPERNLSPSSSSSVKLVCDASEEKLLSNGHVKGRSHPPNVVLESLPPHHSTGFRTGQLELGMQDDTHNIMAGTDWANQGAADCGNGGSKVKHGHSQTWQRNVHCLETEV